MNVPANGTEGCRWTLRTGESAVSSPFDAGAGEAALFYSPLVTHQCAPFLHFGLRSARLSFGPRGAALQFPFLNDPFIEAIAKRVRSVIARHPGPCLNAIAERLSLPLGALQPLVDGRDRVIDTSLLIDVVAALVQECAIDPKWLLTGDCDGAMHRRALVLGEDRSRAGTRALREFVYSEYRRLRHGKSFIGWPLARPSGHVKP